MIKKYLSLFVVLVAVSVGVISCANAEGTKNLQSDLSSDIVSLIAQSDNITVNHVQQSRKPPFLATSQEKALSVSELKNIKDLLLDDSHYKFGMKKRSLFIPYAAFNVKGDHPITIYVCKTSKELLVDANGKMVYLNYDPMAEQFNQQMTKLLQVGV